MPETRYARGGDYHIAYQTLGDGPIDVVHLYGWLTHVETCWEFPGFAEHFHRIASFARLILFDKRGVGLSDPVPANDLPTLEVWVDDLLAVLDAASSKRAAVIAWADSGAMGMLAASTYPERISALVLQDSFARLSRAPDYPVGIPEHMVEGALKYLGDVHGTGGTIDLSVPDKAADPYLRAAMAKYERQAASPGTARAMLQMAYGVDVRHILPSIGVPTLVIGHTDSQAIRVGHSRYLAEHIPDARYLEFPGRANWALAADDRDDILDEIEEFLTGVRHAREPDRVLATVVFTDIVDSTKQAAARGDRAWGEMLSRHRDVVRRQLERHRGREVSSSGDGFLATFDGPARAIRCARAIVEASRPLGIEVRIGLHTGEIELIGADVGGIAVHIGARVSALAGAGEVLVSSTVKDLVVGSGIEFEERGARELKGVPGEWRLFAVRS